MPTYEEIKNESDEEFAAQWEQWHRQREQALNSEYGWLSLRSIDWLEDGSSTRIEGFPGTWTQKNNTVTYTPDSNADVTNRGKVIHEPLDITVDATADVNVEDFDYQGVRAQLIKRIGSGRQFAVRQRDPNSVSRQTFSGVPHFKPDKKWVFPARYESLESWHTVETAAVLGDLSHNETAIGNLYIQIEGKEYPIVVFQGHNDDSGWTKKDERTGKTVYLDNRQNVEGEGFVLFRDETSGNETYGGARALHIDVSEPEKISYVDFNRATNLPCAFTYFCTCPFAPRQNLLPLAIKAGEKTPVIIDKN